MVVLRRSTKTGAAVFFGAMLMRSALAELAPNAARTHRALLAAKPLFSSRSLGTRGAGRPLDRDIAIRIGRAAAVPAAGPRVVIYRRLPLT